MAKRTQKTVTMKLHKNGTMTLSSTGGVDLRKVVPSLFPPHDPAGQPVASQPSEEHVVLARKHTGIKVDYSGLLTNARRGLGSNTAIAEMLFQMEEHLSELGQRWYDGDPTVVDEFLQLYCIQQVRRAVLAAKAETSLSQTTQAAPAASMLAGVTHDALPQTEGDA